VGDQDIGSAGRPFSSGLQVPGEPGRKDWIEQAQERDRWRVLVNEVMNLGVP